MRTRLPLRSRSGRPGSGRTRRTGWIAALAALALVSTACGSGEQNASAEGQTRALKTPNGTVQIPVSPKSVVALDQYSYFGLLDVGVHPKATASGYSDSFPVFPEYAKEYEQVPKVGGSLEIDMEQVGAQGPDLILGNKFLSLERHSIEDYQKVAPTAIFGGAPGEPGVAWPIWVIEAADAGLAGLHALARRAVVAVTGDHATPSVDGVLHTGDPTPLVVAGPAVRQDGVREFGEAQAHAGWYGQVRAAELLPLLFGHANRPVFLGHRATPRMSLALPDAPESMPLSQSGETHTR